MATERLTRAAFLRSLAGAGAAGPLASLALASLEGCAKDDGAVNFFNWSKYIAPETLPAFTRRTGIPVNYEEFADEEEMFAKLRSGARGYDLIVATDYMIPRLRTLNLIEPLPSGALPNAKNVDPAFRGTPFDPGDEYSAPYLWGTTGIGFNREKISRPPDSWQALWDPAHSGRMTILDNARDTISTALLLKGLPETTTDPAHLAAVKELLLAQRPLVKQYSSASYIDGLVAGEIDLAMAWSGDCLQAARENPKIDYLVPKEGSYRWVDTICLVRGAPHREAALRLIDYLLEGETAAGIANAVRYATPNAAARALLDKSLLADPRVFPPPSIEKLLRFHALQSPEAAQLWNQLWSEIKLG